MFDSYIAYESSIDKFLSVGGDKINGVLDNTTALAASLTGNIAQVRLSSSFIHSPTLLLDPIPQPIARAAPQCHVAIDCPFPMYHSTISNTNATQTPTVLKNHTPLQYHTTQQHLTIIAIPISTPFRSTIQSLNNAINKANDVKTGVDDLTNILGDVSASAASLQVQVGRQWYATYLAVLFCRTHEPDCHHNP